MQGTHFATLDFDDCGNPFYRLEENDMTEQESIADHEKAYELLFKANSKLQKSHDKLVRALEKAIDYVECAYSNNFPDGTENKAILQECREALAAAKGE